MIIEPLFTAACALMSFGCELPPPTVEYVSEEWLKERACPSRKCGNHSIWGWYNDEGTIYLWVDAPDGVLWDSIVVHEIIHYLQHMRGHPGGYCEREREAYGLQDRYLTEHRGSLPSPHPMC